MAGPDGGMDGSISIKRKPDVRRLVAALEALRTSEEHYRKLFQMSLDA